MAIIARVQPEVTRIGNLPTVRNEVRYSSAPMEGIADAMRGAAGEVQKFAEKKQDEQDTIALLSASRQYQDWESGLLDDPDNPDGMGAYKGRNSLGATDGLVPKADAKISEIGDTLTPRQRLRWTEISAGYRNQFHGRVSREAVSRHDAFTTNERKLTIESATNSAALAIGSGDDALAQSKVQDAVAKFEVDQNLEFGEVNPQATASYRSKLYNAGIASALGRNDYTTANRLYERYKDALDVGDRLAVDKAMTPYREDAEDSAELPAILSGSSSAYAPGTGDVKLPYAETDNYVRTIMGRAGDVSGGNAEAIADKLLPHLIRQESGGKQSAVSKKGARGTMQLMPATARMLERQLGMPEGLTDTDADANVRAGRQYLIDRLNRYNLDPRKALAAYNAGDAPVDRWQAEGRFNGGQSHPQAPARDITDATARIRSMYPGNKPKQDRLIVLAKQHFAEVDQAKRDQMEAINLAIENSAPGAKLHTFLSQSDIALLRNEGKLDTAEKYQTDRYYGAMTQDDPEYAYSLTVMRLRDPAGFAKLDMNAPEVAKRLSVETRQKFASDIASLREGGAKVSKKRADWATAQQRIDSGLRILGLDELKDPKDKAVVANRKQQRAQFALVYREAEQAFIQKYEREPRPEEADALLRSVTRNVAEDIPKKLGRAGEIEGFNTAMSQTDRAEIISDFKAEVGRDPTDAEIMQIAIAHRARGGANGGAP